MAEKLKSDGFKKKLLMMIGAQIIMYIGPLIIPTWGPVTPMGVKMLCVYVGVLFMFIATGDLFSGSLLGMLATILHGYSTANDMFLNVFGGSSSTQMVAMLTLATCVRETGALDILGRKIIRATRGMKKLPFLFCIVFMLAMYIVLWYISGLAAVMTLFPMFESIAKTVGYEVDEKWHKIMIVILFLMAGGASYSRGTNGLLLGWIGIFEKAVNFPYVYKPVQFMISSRITLAVILIVWMLVAKFLGADMKKLSKLDFDSIPELRKENCKWDKRQIICLILFFAVLIRSLITNPFAKDTLGYLIFATFDLRMGSFIALVLGTYIRIDGKPIMDVPKALSKLPWGVYLVLGTMMTIAGALSSMDLGIRAWLVQILSPIFGTSNYYLFCFMILLFTVFITNLMSNQATIMIMLSLAATFMDKFVDAGYNVTPLVAMICCLGNFAVLLYCSGPISPYFLDRKEMKADQKFVFTVVPLLLLVCVAFAAGGAVIFGKLIPA
ncbi:MAG: hypothetical protein II718_04860 [Clostridiales bacterium]|nr:hypothetical protein [Clostridiales bacterium]